MSARPQILALQALPALRALLALLAQLSLLALLALLALQALQAPLALQALQALLALQALQPHCLLTLLARPPAQGSLPHVLPLDALSVARALLPTPSPHPL